MPYKNILILICFVFLQTVGVGNIEKPGSYLLVKCDQQVIDSNIFAGQEIVLLSKKRPSPLFQLFRAKQKKNRKITAALLAFPLPFGIVGLHRIYLGSAPYVPVVYITSLGGAFGILPFIDFCVLLMDKNADRYVNNKKVFMWVN